MEVRVRTIETGDYRAVAEIINRVEAPWRTTAAETRAEDGDALGAGGAVFHHVAVEIKQGRVIGHGVLRGAGASHCPQPYALELRVHPDWWRRGAGDRLWQSIQADLRGLQPASVRVWVRERWPAGLAFAADRGFAEVRRSGLWVRDVAQADLGPLLPALARAASAGVTLTTLAQERERSPLCLPALHRLRVAVDADIPVAEPYPVLSEEDFAREAEGAWAEGFLIARRGDEYVGLSCLSFSPADPQELHQAITGVRPDCRRQGIATALKVRGLQLAQERGYARIVTSVDSTNTPMALLNQKLGFRGGNDAVLMERPWPTAEPGKLFP